MLFGTEKEQCVAINFVDLFGRLDGPGKTHFLEGRLHIRSREAQSREGLFAKEHGRSRLRSCVIIQKPLEFLIVGLQLRTSSLNLLLAPEVGQERFVFENTPQPGVALHQARTGRQLKNLADALEVAWFGTRARRE